MKKTDITTVKVGVVGEYNAQWDTVNKLLEKDKIKVELVKYSDYATPNRALSDKEIDLNAFQHKAYLANDIKRNGYKIVAIGDTLVTPLRIFNNKQKIKAIADIKDGDKIAIPADLTNGGRALKLLEAAGLFTLNPDKGYVPNKTIRKCRSLRPSPACSQTSCPMCRRRSSTAAMPLPRSSIRMRIQFSRKIWIRRRIRTLVSSST